MPWEGSHDRPAFLQGKVEPDFILAAMKIDPYKTKKTPRLDKN